MVVQTDEMIAEELRHAFEEIFMLDGSCVGLSRCQDSAVRDWRNQMGGGLRIVSSYQSG